MSSHPRLIYPGGTARGQGLARVWRSEGHRVLSPPENTQLQVWSAVTSAPPLARPHPRPRRRTGVCSHRPHGTATRHGHTARHTTERPPQGRLPSPSACIQLGTLPAGCAHPLASRMPCIRVTSASSCGLPAVAAWGCRLLARPLASTGLVAFVALVWSRSVSL